MPAAVSNNISKSQTIAPTGKDCATAVSSSSGGSKRCATPAAISGLNKNSSHELICNKKTGETYTLHGMLGKGGFAKCFLVEKQPHNEYEKPEQLAAKIIDKKSLAKPKTKQKLGTEIKIHQSLDNEHVVGFRNFFEDRKHVYIMLEICHCKSMMELIKKRKRLTELETKYLMIQLLHGVQYMHSELVIHRDLKLGNIFLDENMQVKIGDFGLAAQLDNDNERKRTICGTPNYIAPEILMSASNGHSYEVDVWSIGVILYTCIIGKPPFETASVKTTYNKIKTTSYSFPPHATISDEARDLICKILTKDPTRRPAISQILHHDFFAKETKDLTRCPDLLKEYVISETGRAPTYVPRSYHNDMPNVSKPISKTCFSDQLSLVERVPFQPIHSNTIGNRLPLKKENTQESSLGAKCSAQKPPSLPASVSQPAPDADHASSTPSALNSPKIWVSEWADFSQKYGLAYKLNTNQTGAHFNDATKMIWYHDSDLVEYYERCKTPNGSYDKKHSHHIDDYPESLKKKITLITYFRQYLEKTEKKKRENSSEMGDDLSSCMSEADREHSQIYVKRWMRTKHAVIFRLSNKTVQVCFRDNTEIILSSEAKLVTYKDEKRAKETFHLSKIIEVRNQEVAKRLRYTKDILKQLISK